MSDTPRTDKFTHSISKLANHARQLERELAAAESERIEWVRRAEYAELQNEMVSGLLKRQGGEVVDADMRWTPLPGGVSAGSSTANATAHARAVASNVQQIVGNSGGDE